MGFRNAVDHVQLLLKTAVSEDFSKREVSSSCQKTVTSCLMVWSDALAPDFGSNGVESSIFEVLLVFDDLFEVVYVGKVDVD